VQQLVSSWCGHSPHYTKTSNLFPFLQHRNELNDSILKTFVINFHIKNNDSTGRIIGTVHHTRIFGDCRRVQYVVCKFTAL
jgi:hypothetical protein